MKTGKRFCALLLSVVMIALLLPVTATAAEAGWADCDGFKCWLEPEKGTAVICGRAEGNAAETLEIPATVSYEGTEYQVTLIDGSAFEGDDIVTGVTVAEGIREIGAGALSHCGSLTDLTLPDSLCVIGASAFQGCSSLAEINLPGSLEQIERSAFEGTAFYEDDENWSSADPDDDGEERCVLYCGDYLIKANDIGESVFVKEGTRLIADWAFWAFYSLSAVSIPASVEWIGVNAFVNCSSLSQVTFAEDSRLTSIGSHAFDTDRSLTAIDLPAGVETIGQCAFADTGLTDIVLPDGLSVIQGGLFKGCGSLREVTIPASVTEIGMWAFYGCDALEVVHYNGTKAQWDEITGVGKADIEEKVQCLPSVGQPPVIVKAANPLQIKAKTPAIKYTTLKKKSQKLKITKLLKFVNKGEGKRSYKIVSARKGDENVAKWFKINPKTGTLFVRSGLKKGTFKVRIQVKAAGNDMFKAGKKTVTVKIKVK